MKAYYDDLWERLPEDLSPPDRPVREAFLRRSVRGGDRVLDLGCGDGTFLRALREATGVAGSVIGADVAEAALARAAPRARAAQADTRLVPVDGPLPFADAAFDAVWASEVIEHVADTGAWLSEVRRILAPGGRLLVTTPSHGRVRLALLGLQRLAPPLGDHLHLYTGRSLRELLASDFGFAQVRVRSVGGPPLARRMLLARGVR